MKLLSLFLIWTLLPFVSRADPNEEAQDFCKISEAARLDKIIITIHFDSLPILLQAELQHYYLWETDDGNPPRDIYGFITDLNQDGRLEYCICDQAGSGTGGPMYMIFSQISGSWHPIYHSQGSLHLLSSRTEWPLLVSLSRSGMEIFWKTYYAFESGSYEPTMIESYVRGKISKKRIKKPKALPTMTPNVE